MGEWRVEGNGYSWALRGTVKSSGSPVKGLGLRSERRVRLSFFAMTCVLWLVWAFRSQLRIVHAISVGDTP